MSSEVSKYLRLAKRIVPALVVPIVWLVQSGGRFPPVILLFIGVAIVLTIASAVSSSGIIRRTSRGGRVDEICDDVAARGRSVADDLLANRPSNL